MLDDVDGETFGFVAIKLSASHPIRDPNQLESPARDGVEPIETSGDRRDLSIMNIGSGRSNPKVMK